MQVNLSTLFKSDLNDKNGKELYSGLQKKPRDSLCTQVTIPTEIAESYFAPQYVEAMRLFPNTVWAPSSKAPMKNAKRRR